MKNLRILVSTLIIGVLFVGCTQEMKNTGSIVEKKVLAQGTTPPEDENNTSEPKWDFDHAGEIIEIKEDIVTLLSGDIAEDFKFDKDILENFYLGQEVTIKDDKLAPYIPTNPNSYNIKHTSMGEIILSSIGEIKNVTSDSFILTVDGKDVDFQSYLSKDEQSRLKKGMNVTVDYLMRDGSQFAINFYDESSTINLKIVSLGRNDSGEMTLSTETAEGGKFEVIVSSSTDINFNHSEIKPGDSIKIYPTKMTKSIPAQVATSKIILSR